MTGCVVVSSLPEKTAAGFIKEHTGLVTGLDAHAWAGSKDGNCSCLLCISVSCCSTLESVRRAKVSLASWLREIVDVPPDWSEGVIGTEKEGQGFGAMQRDLKGAPDLG